MEIGGKEQEAIEDSERNRPCGGLLDQYPKEGAKICQQALKSASAPHEKEHQHIRLSYTRKRKPASRVLYTRSIEIWGGNGASQEPLARCTHARDCLPAPQPDCTQIATGSWHPHQQDGCLARYSSSADPKEARDATFSKLNTRGFNPQVFNFQQ